MFTEVNTVKQCVSTYKISQFHNPQWTCEYLVAYYFYYILKYLILYLMHPDTITVYVCISACIYTRTLSSHRV